jgi:hypothetical protein
MEAFVLGLFNKALCDFLSMVLAALVTPPLPSLTETSGGRAFPVGGQSSPALSSPSTTMVSSLYQLLPCVSSEHVDSP